MLATDWKLSYFSTGKQLRQEITAGSEIGQRAEPFLAAGHYVPDDLAIDLALDWLSQVKCGWVLDGFPRTLAQAQSLDTHLHPEEAELRALLLEVPSQELERRVAERRECTSCAWTGTRTQAEHAGKCPSCGAELTQRRDDALENFRMRWKAFDELTAPVADYYEASNRLLRINGAGAPEEVLQRVHAAFAHP
jgi:adenylate kinase